MAGIDLLLRERALRLAHPRAEVLLHRDDLLDDVVALDEGGGQDVLRDLLRARLDHHDRVLGAGHQQVQLALRLEVGGGGVDHEGPVPVAHPHRADRPVERDVGDDERRGGADDGEGVRVVLEVGGEQQADDLGLARVALGKERPQRPVDHPGGEDLLLVRPSLALEEAAGDLAARVVALAVVDREGQEVESHPRLALRARRRQDHGVAEAHQDCSVGLLGHLPRLDRQGVAAKGHFHSIHFSLLSALCRDRPRGAGNRRSGRGGIRPTFTRALPPRPSCPWSDQGIYLRMPSRPIRTR